MSKMFLDIFSVIFPDTLQEFSPLKFVPNKECHQVLRKTEQSLTSNMVCSFDGFGGICHVSKAL